ncbi:MAG: flagellar hook-basal body complex protein [Hungatella sp.]|nr:flagellar hook-basal body complex protein [Hungatella sp.]
MLRAMDSAVAGLRAHQNKMDVVGHNIANVNTDGFKAQTYTFKEAMYQTSTASTGNNGTAGGVNAAQYGYGTLMGTIGMDMTASTPTYRGGFNASIDGEGFFLVMTTAVADGIETTDANALKAASFYYTRVGQFSVDSSGYVVDGNGNFVYGYEPSDPVTGKVEGDKLDKLVPLRAPTKLADNATIKDVKFDYDPKNTGVEKLGKIQIDNTGKISASIEIGGKAQTIYLGTVGIATFQNPNGLAKVGNNYYVTTAGDNTGTMGASIPGGLTSTLMPGYIEASNVDLAKEFADMITTHRGFQANSKMITVSDEMLSDLVAMKR